MFQLASFPSKVARYRLASLGQITVKQIQHLIEENLAIRFCVCLFVSHCYQLRITQGYNFILVEYVPSVLNYYRLYVQT